MDLAAFSIQKIEIFILVLTRTAGIFTLNPTFGSNQIPMQSRVGIAVAMSMIFVPMVHPAGTMPSDVFNLFMLVIREGIIGLTISFICSMVFTAIEIAGQLIDAQSGFSFATMVDPTNGQNSAVSARIQNLFGIVLFFAINAHHLVIQGLAQSFTIAPIGQLTLNSAVAGRVIDLFTALFVVAIRMAIPVVAACFLADIALAVTSRVVPQMNVMMVGMPMKLSVGLMGLLIALPMTFMMNENLFRDMFRHTTQIIGVVAR